MSVQDSSSSTSTNTLATQQHEWDVTGSIPDKPSNWQRTKAQESPLHITTLASLSALVVTAVYAVYRMLG